MMAPRPIALITGACGGLGRAFARQFGQTHDLAISDVDQARLEAFAETLREEGYTVPVVLVGDIAAAGTAPALVEAAAKAGPIRVVLHAAGRSESVSEWSAVMQSNLVGTERLLQALEEVLQPGLVAVLIASMSGHAAPADAEFDAVLAEPLAADFLERVKPHVVRIADPAQGRGLSRVAYNHSKRAMIRTCEARAAAWGAKGARIVSISPGPIMTPMLRAEIQANPAVGALITATPAGRVGAPADIAQAAAFLASDRASFITGADLRVDGGATVAMLGVTF